MTFSEHLDAGARALDALPADEIPAFDEHLATCGSCAAEYAEFLETAGRLADAAATAAPLELRATVLAQARVTPQLPPLTTGADPVEPAGRAARAARARWWTRPATLLAAAAAVAVVIGGVVFATRTGPTPQQVAERCVSTAPDAEVVGPTVGEGGTVTIARSCDAAVVHLQAMPPLPADKGYQLWVMAGSDARSVKMVTTADVSGTAIVIDDIRASDTDIGISVEPAGGSATPTSAPVWVVPIES